MSSLEHEREFENSNEVSELEFEELQQVAGGPEADNDPRPP